MAHPTSSTFFRAMLLSKKERKDDEKGD